MTDRTSKDFNSPEALHKYLQDHPDADKSKHHVKKDTGGAKEKKVSPHALRDKAEEHTKAGRHDDAAIHYMGAAHRFREEGAHGAAKSMEDAARDSAKKHHEKAKKKQASDQRVAGDFFEALIVRNVVARAMAAEEQEEAEETQQKQGAGLPQNHLASGSKHH